MDRCQWESSTGTARWLCGLGGTLTTARDLLHDDVIKWKHFPRYRPFMRGIRRSPANPITKASDAERWCFFDLRLNKRLSRHRHTSDLTRHCAHYYATVMFGWYHNDCPRPLPRPESPLFQVIQSQLICFQWDRLEQTLVNRIENSNIFIEEEKVNILQFKCRLQTVDHFVFPPIYSYLMSLSRQDSDLSVSNLSSSPDPPLTGGHTICWFTAHASRGHFISILMTSDVLRYLSLSSYPVNPMRLFKCVITVTS